MTDKELIGYTKLHSKTPRALFHISHIQRMYELAGEVPPDGNDFYSWPYEDAKPIIEAAEANLAAT